MEIDMFSLIYSPFQEALRNFVCFFSKFVLDFEINRISSFSSFFYILFFLCSVQKYFGSWQLFIIKTYGLPKAGFFCLYHKNTSSLITNNLFNGWHLIQSGFKVFIIFDRLAVQCEGLTGTQWLNERIRGRGKSGWMKNVQRIWTAERHVGKRLEDRWRDPDPTNYSLSENLPYTNAHPSSLVSNWTILLTSFLSLSLSRSMASFNCLFPSDLSRSFSLLSPSPISSFSLCYQFFLFS